MLNRYSNGAESVADAVQVTVVPTSWPDGRFDVRLRFVGASVAHGSVDGTGVAGLTVPT